MGCCDKPFARAPTASGLPTEVSRRSLLKGVAAAAGTAATLAGGATPAEAQGKRVKLAFCGQLLCVVPYEVARANGHFAKGLDVELVYTRGGSRHAGAGRRRRRLRGDLPRRRLAGLRTRRRYPTLRDHRALAAVRRRDGARTRGEIGHIEDLAGRTVGVSALGNADHALMLFLLRRASVDPAKSASPPWAPTSSRRCVRARSMSVSSRSRP